MKGKKKEPAPNSMEGVWQSGSGCFSNNFFVPKYMPMIFFIF
jgi:hypothetical protein